MNHWSLNICNTKQFDAHSQIGNGTSVEIVLHNITRSFILSLPFVSVPITFVHQKYLRNIRSFYSAFISLFMSSFGMISKVFFLTTAAVDTGDDAKRFKPLISSFLLLLVCFVLLSLSLLLRLSLFLMLFCEASSFRFFLEIFCATDKN